MLENWDQLGLRTGQEGAARRRLCWPRVAVLSAFVVGILGAGVVLGQGSVMGRVEKARKFAGKTDCWGIALKVQNGLKPVLVLAFDKDGNVQGLQDPEVAGDPSEPGNAPRRVKDVIPVAVIYENPGKVCYKIAGVEYCVNS